MTYFLVSTKYENIKPTMIYLQVYKCRLNTVWKFHKKLYYAINGMVTTVSKTLIYKKRICQHISLSRWGNVQLLKMLQKISISIKHAIHDDV